MMRIRGRQKVLKLRLGQTQYCRYRSLQWSSPQDLILVVHLLASPRPQHILSLSTSRHRSRKRQVVGAVYLFESTLDYNPNVLLRLGRVCVCCQLYYRGQTTKGPEQSTAFGAMQLISMILAPN